MQHAVNKLFDQAPVTARLQQGESFVEHVVSGNEAAPLFGDLAGAGALVLAAAAGVAALVLAVASLVRWQRFPQALADDLKHPVRHAWAAAMPTALVLLASLGACAVGLLAAFIPARRAARMDPVQAIRT